MSSVLESEYVPVAANCCWLPTTREGEAGVIAMDTNTAEATFKLVVAESELRVAEIVVTPIPADEATP